MIRLRLTLCCSVDACLNTAAVDAKLCWNPDRTRQIIDDIPIPANWTRSAEKSERTGLTSVDYLCQDHS